MAVAALSAAKRELEVAAAAVDSLLLVFLTLPDARTADGVAQRSDAVSLKAECGARLAALQKLLDAAVLNEQGKGPGVPKMTVDEALSNTAAFLDVAESRTSFANGLLLWATAFQNSLPGTAFALVRNADPNTRGHRLQFNSFPLHVACARGHLSVVAALVAQTATELSGSDTDGRTPLCWAVYNARPAVCQLLLSRGAFMGAVDADGNTPLAVAAKRGAEGCVSLLLQHGSPLLANPAGMTALDLARTDDIRRLLSTSPPPAKSPLMPEVVAAQAAAAAALEEAAAALAAERRQIGAQQKGELDALLAAGGMLEGEKAPMAAPGLEEMRRDDPVAFLATVPGLAMRQLRGTYSRQLPDAYDPSDPRAFSSSDFRGVQELFEIREYSSICSRLCCFSRRGFTADVIAPNREVVMQLERPYRNSGVCCCPPTCGYVTRPQTLYAYGPPIGVSPNALRGSFLGEVTQNGSCHCCKTQLEYDILDGSGRRVFSLVKRAGLFDKVAICAILHGDHIYTVLGAEGQPTGSTIESVGYGICVTQIVIPLIQKILAKYCGLEDIKLAEFLPPRLNVTFHKTATAEERRLLYVATVYIDYVLYDGRDATHLPPSWLENLP